MAKTFVVDPKERQARTPFRRGILTSSFNHAGLPFEEAYALASKVRKELNDRPEVTTQKLREIVWQLISKYDSAPVQRYESPAAYSEVPSQGPSPTLTIRCTMVLRIGAPTDVPDGLKCVQPLALCQCR